MGGVVLDRSSNAMFFDLSVHDKYQFFIFAITEKTGKSGELILLDRTADTA